MDPLSDVLSLVKPRGYASGALTAGGDWSVAVNAVEPGGIETDFGGGALRNADLQRSLVSATPYGRVGVPDDVGALVASLCDPAMRWMTGKRLELTGGFAL